MDQLNKLYYLATDAATLKGLGWTLLWLNAGPAGLLVIIGVLVLTVYYWRVASSNAAQMDFRNARTNRVNWIAIYREFKRPMTLLAITIALFAFRIYSLRSLIPAILKHHLTGE